MKAQIFRSNGIGLTATIIVVIIFTGCACSIPDWYNKPPKDPNYLFASGAGTSVDMETARDKASISARQKMAQYSGEEFDALQKRFVNEITTERLGEYHETFTNVIKSIHSIYLQGVSMEESKICKEGSGYRAYVLMRYNFAAAKESLLNSIKEKERMYLLFKETQAFKELEEEVEEFKKEHGGR